MLRINSFSYTGTDIKDKVKMVPSTTALKKILSSSTEESENQAQPLEEGNVMSLETPSAEDFQRFLLQCDLRENMMLETSMSDTSTWWLYWTVLIDSRENSKK